MRGRKPRPITVGRVDRSRLEQIAHSLCLPWYQVRRARIILGRAAGQRIFNIAQESHCNASTIRRTCLRYEHQGLLGLLACAKKSGRPVQILPLQRAKIVHLACLEPVAKGLHITPWSSADLARVSVAEGIVPAVSSRTVRRILQEVDLQPQRTRFR